MKNLHGRAKQQPIYPQDQGEMPVEEGVGCEISEQLDPDHEISEHSGLCYIARPGDPLKKTTLGAALMAVVHAGGNKTVAARALGVSTHYIYERLKPYRDLPLDQLERVAADAGVFGLGEERDWVRTQQDAANCWIAPGFDAIQMVQELVQAVRGRGGRIGQEMLYVEPLAAQKWLDYEQHPEYLAIYRDLPLDRAARAMRPLVSKSLAVVALGPGGGTREGQLVQYQLAAGLDVQRFYLLDLSQPLLARAVRHAETTLPTVRVVGIWGNMYHLPRYDAMLPYEDSSLTRVVTMLGCTFGNLPHEVEFVRDALGPLAPGDLFLFDCCLRPAEEDFRLARPLPESLIAWITMPLRQHGGAKIIDVRSERTEETTVVRGSYAVDFVARVEGGREFRLVTMRRYDEAQLVAGLARVGWQHRATFAFSQDYPRALMLFQKGESQPGEQPPGGQP